MLLGKAVPPPPPGTSGGSTEPGDSKEAEGVRGCPGRGEARALGGGARAAPAAEWGPGPGPPSPRRGPSSVTPKTRTAAPCGGRAGLGSGPWKWPLPMISPHPGFPRELSGRPRPSGGGDLRQETPLGGGRTAEGAQASRYHWLQGRRIPFCPPGNLAFLGAAPAWHPGRAGARGPIGGGSAAATRARASLPVGEGEQFW